MSTYTVDPATYHHHNHNYNNGDRQQQHDDKLKERIRIEDVTEGCPLTALTIFITGYLQPQHQAPEVEVVVRKMPLRYAIICPP